MTGSLEERMRRGRLRVALIGRFPLEPDTFAGGLETSAANLLAGLQSLGDMELHVITFSRVTDASHLSRDGISFHYLPAPARLNTLTLHLRTRRTLKRFLKELQPDVLHALDALDSGYICLKSANDYPLVVSIHGIVREERKHISGAKDQLRTVLTSRLIEQYCIKNARFLIEPTRYPEEYFKRLITGKVFDTGNPIADSFFELRSDPEPERLLYSGAIIPRKRLLDLIQVMKQLSEAFPRTVLRVAGGAPDHSYMSLVREAIENARLAENVILLGQLSPDQLREEYRRCALLILPSAQETSPMAIGEVMASGKPVVATRVGGIPYLVQEGETGFLIDPGDIDALENRIVRLLRDRELQRRMGLAARESAERQFRSRAVATRVRQVYLEAISDSKTLPRQ
jgi:glycosyltransferase involved in cell wall biosynthesis